ncbi:DUF2207 domain-containing protein [Actinacidiphila bryophytorum]|uniref:DUF2207 domain-containing protein n=1 Tax=Actinacidiphila bryophytorum TaxID=1436133 RepID=A0A9W4MIJ1_9ACTN|nr:DUF2207 domain-containing protein [Actinacidiphila bryophytorum]MBM9437176.1 DUF2207 domain-containing protein [Actinacidiphila bryophytorum]MBN6546145.1 DUF2207 domain-containing protein [Actinacidiphila bryophytorum]CAG7647004.1 hypothetical protein SBRY_40551 [Actinacidiphila bryophytorum]
MTATGLPPEAVGGLRPAEAGVLVDRGPRPAHIVATVVDLAQRGWLGIAAHEADEDGDGDWTFSRVRSPARWLAQRRELARYERQLLRGIFGHRSQVRFTRIVSGGIRGVYHRLTQDALAQGWLGPTATVAGLDAETEQLRADLRAMRVTLEGLRPPAGVDALDFYSRWLPYAVALGLMPAWARQLDVLGAKPALVFPSGTSFTSADTLLMSWWNGSFATQMAGAVDTWSHQSGGSGGIWGHDGGGHGHHSGHHGHHGGFDGGHHGGFGGDGGGGDGGGGSW